MKKIIACLLLCSLLLSTCAFAATITDIDQCTNAEAVNYLVELGILTTVKDAFAPQQTMTRAEYVDAVLKLIGVETGEYLGSGKTDIYDVTEYMEYYSAVLFALDMGLVTGNGDGTFRPKETITVADAVVILVRALGYEPLAQDAGGYVAGYVSRANRLELLNGVTVDGELTHDACAQLFYNALEVEILKAVSYGTDKVVLRSVEGETVLTEYHNVQQVTDLVVEQVYEMQTEDAEKGHIKLDDGTILYYDGSEDLVGEVLEIHYRENKATNRKTVFQIQEAYDVKALTLDAIDTEYKNMEFTYGNDKKAKIGALTRVFYNGEELTPFDASLLDPAMGTIKLIDNKGGYYRIAKITSYKDYCVEDINTDNEIIYDKGGIKQSFTYKNVNYVVLLGGEKVAIESVSRDMVMSVAQSKDGSKARIVLNNAKSEGSVYTYTDKSVGTYCTMTVGEETVKYLVSSVIATKMKKEIEPGNVAVVYLNFLGYIADFEKGASMDYVYGYLANTAENETGFNQNLMLKIYTEGGILAEYQTEKEITIDGDYGIKAIDCYTKLSTCQLIRYIVNENGKVSAIDTAYSATKPRGKNESEKSFHEINFPAKGDATWVNSMSTLEGGIVVDSGKTKKIYIPENPQNAEADDFEINYALANNTEYSVDAYNSDPDSFIADVVLIYAGSAASYSTASRPLYINYAYEAMNDKGKNAIFLNGFQNGSLVDLEIREGCTGKTYSGTTIDVKALEGGDIARILTDSKKRIIDVQLLWDRSATEGEGKSWKDGAMMTTKTLEGETVGATNLDYNHTVRFIWGDVYTRDANYFKVRYQGSTSTDLATMPLFSNTRPTIYLYGPHSDGSWFKKSSASEMLSYKIDPTNCSKVFMRQYYTTTIECVIFNDQK